MAKSEHMGEPDWELEKAKIEQEKVEKGIGRDSFYKFVEGENKIEIDITKKSIPFTSNFGKDRIKLTLTDGSVIAISPVLYDEVLNHIIDAKKKGQDSVVVNVLRIGTGATDTKYKIKK